MKLNLESYELRCFRKESSEFFLSNDESIASISKRNLILKRGSISDDDGDTISMFIEFIFDHEVNEVELKINSVSDF